MNCPKCGCSLYELERKKQKSRKSRVIIMVCWNYPLCSVQASLTLKNKVIGSPADSQTRYWRMRAHREFDRMWKGKAGIKNKHRNKAYIKLSKILNIPIEKCHIGFFTEEQCKIVIEKLKER